jgi:hypothetical protein
MPEVRENSVSQATERRFFSALPALNNRAGLPINAVQTQQAHRDFARRMTATDRRLCVSTEMETMRGKLQNDEVATMPAPAWKPQDWVPADRVAQSWIPEGWMPANVPAPSESASESEHSIAA